MSHKILDNLCVDSTWLFIPVIYSKTFHSSTISLSHSHLNFLCCCQQVVYWLLYMEFFFYILNGHFAHLQQWFSFHLKKSFIRILIQLMHTHKTIKLKPTHNLVNGSNEWMNEFIHIYCISFKLFSFFACGLFIC